MLKGKSINKMILVGVVGRDPDVLTTDRGKVAHFSLATTHAKQTEEGGAESRTQWHRITLEDGLAGFAEQWVRKGDRLYIEGRLEYDSYERDGITIPTAEIVARELVNLGRGRD